METNDKRYYQWGTDTHYIVDYKNRKIFQDDPWDYTCRGDYDGPDGWVEVGEVEIRGDWVSGFDWIANELQREASWEASNMEEIDRLTALLRWGKVELLNVRPHGNSQI